RGRRRRTGSTPACQGWCPRDEYRARPRSLLPFELWLALLHEGTPPFGGIRRQHQVGEHVVLVGKTDLDRGALRDTDQVLRGLDRDRRRRRDRPRELESTLHQSVPGQQLLHEADPMGLAAIDPITGQEQPQGMTRTDRAGEKL